MWQNEFVDLLSEQFQTLQSKNPRFSIRAFAKKVGLSPGSLSDTLQKKKRWQISADRASEILDRIPVTAAKKNRLLVKMAKPTQYPKIKAETSHFAHLKNWAFYPVLFSFDLPHPLNTTLSISRRLGLAVEKVEALIAELTTRRLLTLEKDGSLSKSDVDHMDGDGPSRAEIRDYHSTMLSVANRALQTVPADRRDFSCLTFAGDEKHLAFLREEIRKLHASTSALMDEGKNNTHVFQLSVQLFPMDFTPPHFSPPICHASSPAPQPETK